MVSQEIIHFVETYAFKPTGTSVAAAIVCSVIYFCFAFIAVGNWIYTKYSFYDVPIISAVFRGVSFAARAAYLVHYKPALQGVFLAFANAGYGANVAAISLVLFTWFGNKSEQYFSPAVEKFLKWWSIFLAFCIICFGPCVGVVAAGTIFGAWGSHPWLAYRGQTIRSAATYGLLSTNFAQTLTLTVISVRVLTKRKQTNKEGSGLGSNGKNSKLLVRGATGVTALYENKEYVWIQDKYFYTLDTLFELVVLAIMLWPTLLARIACAWPKAASTQKDSGETKA